jgi:hypothetical protein
LLLGAALAPAHRLDEYLQAAFVGIEPGRTAIEVQLTPGVEVYPLVAALIDRDGDGEFSAGEREAYARTVAAQWRAVVDGEAAALVLRHWEFPAVERLREGIGAIRLEMEAPPARREVWLRNAHQPGMSVYSMNALRAPEGVKILAQIKEPKQRELRIVFERAGLGRAWWLVGLAALGCGRLAWLAKRRRAA